MRIHRLAALAAAVLTLLAAAPAGATGAIGTSCDGTTVSIGLEIFHDYDDPAWVGRPLYVRMSEVGTCADPVLLTDAGLAMPAQLTLATPTFQVAAPRADTYYTYTLLLELPDGTLQPLQPGWHASGCGDAVAARGFLSGGSPFLTFLACGSACWDGVLGIIGQVAPGSLSAAELAPYVGTGIPVELHGTVPGPFPMPPSPDLTLTGIAAIPGGDCDAVDVEGSSWGGLKARYR